MTRYERIALWIALAVATAGLILILAGHASRPAAAPMVVVTDEAGRKLGAMSTDTFTVGTVDATTVAATTVTATTATFSDASAGLLAATAFVATGATITDAAITNATIGTTTVTTSNVTTGNIATVNATNITTTTLQGDAGVLYLPAVEVKMANGAVNLIDDNANAVVQIDAAVASPVASLALSAATLYNVTGIIICQAQDSSGDALYAEVQQAAQRYDGGWATAVGDASIYTATVGGASSLVLGAVFDAGSVYIDVTGINGKLYHCTAHSQAMQVQ